MIKLQTSRRRRNRRIDFRKCALIAALLSAATVMGIELMSGVPARATSTAVEAPSSLR